LSNIYPSRQELVELVRDRCSSGRVRLFTIGFGGDADCVLLTELAKSGSGRFFDVEPSSDSLAREFNSICAYAKSLVWINVTVVVTVRAPMTIERVMCPFAFSPDLPARRVEVNMGSFSEGQSRTVVFELSGMGIVDKVEMLCGSLVQGNQVVKELDVSSLLDQCVLEANLARYQAAELLSQSLPGDPRGGSGRALRRLEESARDGSDENRRFQEELNDWREADGAGPLYHIAESFRTQISAAVSGRGFQTAKVKSTLEKVQTAVRGDLISKGILKR
jgi:hypothetical protein